MSWVHRDRSSCYCHSYLASEARKLHCRRCSIVLFVSAKFTSSRRDILRRARRRTFASARVKNGRRQQIGSRRGASLSAAEQRRLTHRDRLHFLTSQCRPVADIDHQYVESNQQPELRPRGCCCQPGSSADRASRLLASAKSFEKQQQRQQCSRE